MQLAVEHDAGIDVLQHVYTCMMDEAHIEQALLRPGFSSW